jgi:hypothetical protein
LFVLIFGACFYGVTIAGITFGSSSDSHLINGNELHYNLYGEFQSDGWTITNLPSYIKSVTIDSGYPTFGEGVPLFYMNVPITISNPNYDSSVPVNKTQLGFGITGNTGLENIMFTDMPYFSFINLILGVMYAFALYMSIAHK